MDNVLDFLRFHAGIASQNPGAYPPGFVSECNLAVSLIQDSFKKAAGPESQKLPDNVIAFPPGGKRERRKP